MKFKIALIMSLLFFGKVEAQKINTNSTSFRLEVTIPTQKDSKVYLGQYWNNATYAIDSAFISKEGKAIFSKNEPIDEGQYFIHIKPDIQVDFLIGKEQNNIKLSLDENDLSKNHVSGSKDTKLLWEYLLHLEQNRKKWDELNTQLKDSTLAESKRKTIQKEMEGLNISTEKYIDSFIDKNKNDWAGTFIKGLNQIDLPYAQPKTQQELRENKQYGKTHYFDNIDLTDPRIWRTNYLITYIDDYFRKWIDPTPDSLAIAASQLVAKTKGNDYSFKQMLSKLTNESLKSLRMGDENIWARLYEDYIRKDRPEWIDSIQARELSRMYEIIRHNRIGMTAQNLKLATMDGDSIETNELQAEYLVIYFYDPGCGHCSVELPKLHHEFYPKYKDKGLEVIAFDITSNIDAWKKFVDNNKLTDWINCIDPDYKSNYWKYYDTSGVPMIYVLDKNKKIIAKKIDLKNLEKLFEYYTQNN